MLAQEKVVDESGKRPDWAGGTVPNFIITSGQGSTIEDAKSKAMILVRDRIVNSVAVVVKSSSSIDINESNKNDVYDYLENYSKSTTNKSADQNFVKGVSETRVAAYYWEKILDKKTGKTFYNYYIKYDFPQSEIDKLVAEFEKRDKEMTNRLNAIDSSIDSYTTVEEMISALAELNKLKDYFPDQRKNIAESAYAKLSRMINSISAEIVSQELGKLEVRLIYAGKLVKTSRVPSVKSNCCTVISNTQVDGVWIIKYDYEDCFPDIENTIDVAFSNGINTKIKAYINAKAATVEFSVLAPLKVKGNELTMEIKSTSGIFTINKVEIDVKGTNKIILVDNIDAVVKYKGLNTVKITSNEFSSLFGYVNGTIYYRESETGELKTKRFNAIEVKKL